MTDSDLKRLRELADAATPGPWEWWNSGKFGVTAIKEDDPGDEKGNLFSCGGDRSADAAFIAAARTAVPALLDEVERLSLAYDQLCGIVDAKEWRIAEADKELERLRAIVRDLATSSPDIKHDPDDNFWCAVCDSELHLGWPSLSEHREECPWRRALEVTK